MRPGSKRRLADITYKERLTCAAAIWEAAIVDGVIELNPWPGLKKQVKIASKPFTKDEIVLIIEGFRSDPYSSHYTDFVCFLFGTGVRTEEAIGLQWQHVSEGCSHVWIGESISRGVEKTTKTNKDRTRKFDIPQPQRFAD
ncbi:tyrosine recombinase XerC [Synechococcus sp. PCC 6312]|uniref:site-specific integrase n=1 Tax=Synechococcus sp. (strain ATCC 27167 / PCC 6312) TaxID=195253 RepID=UPI0002FF68E4|nr:tyrosine-type recombinase/integrase [Synechococcus sp. PCC 6312]